MVRLKLGSAINEIGASSLQSHHTGIEIRYEGQAPGQKKPSIAPYWN